MTRARALLVALCGALLFFAAFHFLGQFDLFHDPIWLTDEPICLNPVYPRWMFAIAISLLLTAGLNQLLKQADFGRVGRWFEAVEKMPENVQEMHDEICKDKK